MGTLYGLKQNTAGIGSLIGIAQGAVTSGFANIAIGGTVINIRVVRGLTLAANDPVIVQRIGSIFVATSIVPPTSAAPPVIDIPGNAPTAGTSIFLPTVTKTYRVDEGIYTGGVLWGRTNSHGRRLGGLWFEGSGVDSLAGKTVTAATFYNSVSLVEDVSNDAVTMRQLTSSYTGSGMPSFTNTSVFTPSSASISSKVVPTSWAQALVNGTIKGFCFYDSGVTGTNYYLWDGLDSFSDAFKLAIDWTS